MGVSGFGECTALSGDGDDGACGRRAVVTAARDDGQPIRQLELMLDIRLGNDILQCMSRGKPGG